MLKNLVLYASMIDFDYRFYKIDLKLQKEIITKITQAEMLILSFNAFYVIYITVSSFLNKILFSAAETLFTISYILLNHLSILTHIYIAYIMFLI